MAGPRGDQPPSSFFVASRGTCPRHLQGDLPLSSFFEPRSWGTCPRPLSSAAQEGPALVNSKGTCPCHHSSAGALGDLPPSSFFAPAEGKTLTVIGGTCPRHLSSAKRHHELIR